MSVVDDPNKEGRSKMSKPTTVTFDYAPYQTLTGTFRPCAVADAPPGIMATIEVPLGNALECEAIIRGALNAALGRSSDVPLIQRVEDAYRRLLAVRDPHMDGIVFDPTPVIVELLRAGKL